MIFWKQALLLVTEYFYMVVLLLLLKLRTLALLPTLKISMFIDVDEFLIFKQTFLGGKPHQKQMIIQSSIFMSPNMPGGDF